MRRDYMSDYEEVPTSLDPRRPLVQTVLNLALNYNGDNAAQDVADVAMSLSVLAKLNGIESDQVLKLLYASETNATTAAHYILYNPE
jgi:hypothetical protein